MVGKEVTKVTNAGLPPTTPNRKEAFEEAKKATLKEKKITIAKEIPTKNKQTKKKRPVNDKLGLIIKNTPSLTLSISQSLRRRSKSAYTK